MIFIFILQKCCCFFSKNLNDPAPLNKHAPEGEGVVPDRINSVWIDEAVFRAKQVRQRSERKNQKTSLAVHIEVYKQARNNVKKASKDAKTRHFRRKLKVAKQARPVCVSTRHETSRSR